VNILTTIGILISQRIKARIRENRVTPATVKTKYGGKKGTTLVKTARLVNSIHHKVDGSTIYVGTNVKYARIHHEGGVIEPKKAKYLAVPLCPLAELKSPREFTNTFINKGIIYQRRTSDKTGKDLKPTALYKLMKRVEIPARPYMFLDRVDRDMICEKVREYLKRVLPPRG